MTERSHNGIIYYRSKSDAYGALIVGCLLLGCATIALTQESVGGIGFSQDFIMLSTYWALPIGVVLVLANIKHAYMVGPTVVAGKDGITILFTPEPIGPVRWSEISGFISFRHQGKWFLGIALEDPLQTLTPIKDYSKPLLRNIGPKAAHLKIAGKMMDDYMASIESELNEMRQVYTWRI
jgi:hypothetical protein